METKVIIEKIPERYVTELQSANQSIQILASELQSPDLVKVLLEKRKAGIHVKLFFAPKAAKFWENQMKNIGIETDDNTMQLMDSEVGIADLCLIADSKLLVGSYLKWY